MAEFPIRNHLVRDMVEILMDDQERYCGECRQKDAEIERLKAELDAAKHGIELERSEVAGREQKIERLVKAGRFIVCALGGASVADSEDEEAWSRAEIRRLFNYCCKEWPELDPTREFRLLSRDSGGS